MLKRFLFLFNEAGDGSGGGGTGGAAADSGAGGADAGAAAAAASAAASSDGSAAAATAAGTVKESLTVAPWLKEDFSFEEGWQNKLPADKFGDTQATLANFRDLPSLAKALKDNMATARAKTDGQVKIPTPPAADAKPEALEAYKAEVAAYHKAIGVPDKPEDYGLKAPEKLPDGVTWNEGHAKAFAELSKELGLTPQQAQKLSAFQMGLTAQQHQTFLAEMQKNDQAEDAKILQAFGQQADKRLFDAKRAGLTFFGNENGPQTRAELMIGLAKITDAISEDKLLSGGQVANKLGPEAMASEIMHDPASPYNNPSHPRHREQVAQVNSYMEKAYPR